MSEPLWVRRALPQLAPDARIVGRADLKSDRAAGELARLSQRTLTEIADDLDAYNHARSDGDRPEIVVIEHCALRHSGRAGGQVLPARRAGTRPLRRGAARREHAGPGRPRRRLVRGRNPYAGAPPLLPEPPAGHSRVSSNDVEVDGRGLLYLIDRGRGLHILERT